jgi:hypothetical protein
VGEDDAVGERLNELGGPLVAGGGLDGDPEGVGGLEVVPQLLGLRAGEAAAVGDTAAVAVADDDAQGEGVLRSTPMKFMECSQFERVPRLVRLR